MRLGRKRFFRPIVPDLGVQQQPFFAYQEIPESELSVRRSPVVSDEEYNREIERKLTEGLLPSDEA